MSSSDPTLAVDLYRSAHLTGEFLLRSGVVSHHYFDKYLFEGDPALLKRIVDALAPLVPEGIDALAGLETGGIPIATLLSQATGLPTLFVRKTAKEYGTRKLAEGGEVAGRRLLIVEDVVTSGGQVAISSDDLRDLGAEVAHALCVIDRQAGGPERLAERGIALRSLFTMEELTASAGAQKG
jgi:orotate phosphoribosyltransferase